MWFISVFNPKALNATFNLLAVATPRAFKLVEDTVVLVQITKLSAQVLVNVDLFNGRLFITDIPDLQGQVVSREDVVAVF